LILTKSFNKTATEVKIPLKEDTPAYTENVQSSNRSFNEDATPSEKNRKYHKQVSNISEMEFDATMGQPDLDTLGKFFSNNNVGSPHGDDTSHSFTQA
jgi:hypothetical protein